METKIMMVLAATTGEYQALQKAKRRERHCREKLVRLAAGGDRYA